MWKNFEIWLKSKLRNLGIDSDAEIQNNDIENLFNEMVV